MDFGQKRKIKYLFHWSGALLVAAIFIFFKIAHKSGIDYSSYYYLFKGLQVVGIVFMAVSFYLHRCEICQKNMYGFIFTKECKSCGSQS